MMKLVKLLLHIIIKVINVNWIFFRKALVFDIFVNLVFKNLNLEREMAEGHNRIEQAPNLL